MEEVQPLWMGHGSCRKAIRVLRIRGEAVCYDEDAARRHGLRGATCLPHDLRLNVHLCASGTSFTNCNNEAAAITIMVIAFFIMRCSRTPNFVSNGLDFSFCYLSVAFACYSFSKVIQRSVFGVDQAWVYHSQPRALGTRSNLTFSFPVGKLCSSNR